MRKKMWKRVTAFIMAMVMIVGMESMGNFAGLVNVAKAADVSGWSNEYVSATADTGTWTYSAGSLSGSVTAANWSSKTATLTFENTSTKAINLSFDITSLDINNGGESKISLNGTSAENVVQGKTYSYFNIAPQTKISITLKAPWVIFTAGTSRITISNISCTESTAVTITTTAGTGGSIVSPTTEQMVEQGDTVTLEALPSDGYTFGYWKDSDGNVLSTENPYNHIASKNTTIQAVFYDGEPPVWGVSGKTFANWDDAVAYARITKSYMVVLMQDYVLPSDLTVPSDITLLIPCKDGDTGLSGSASGSSPDGASGGTESLYRTLTIPSGITLTVNGYVIVNAVVGQGATNGTLHYVTGGYGKIVLDGKINVSGSGAKLDSFGYIQGSGEVTATSGAVIGDLFVMENWRGGSHAAYSVFGSTTNAAFGNVVDPTSPFVMYRMHNIQTKLTLHSGAAYEGLVKMYASDLVSYHFYFTRFPYIGSGDSGLIRLSGGAVLTKTYENGSNYYTISGGATFASEDFELAGTSMETSDFLFPIVHDTIFVLNGEGNTYTFANSYKFMPGSALKVGDGATLKINSGVRVAIYDREGTNTNGNIYDACNYMPYPSSYAAAYLELAKTAKLEISGTDTVEVFGGDVYVLNRNNVTYNGEAVTSLQVTSKEVVTWIARDDAGNAKTDYTYVLEWMYADYADVFAALEEVPDNYESLCTSATVAALKNAITNAENSIANPLSDSEENQATVDALAAAIRTAIAGLRYSVTFDAQGGKFSDSSTTHVIEDMDFNTETVYRDFPVDPTRTGYTFAGWYTGVNGSGTKVVESDTCTVGNHTLYAHWTANSYKVSFDLDYTGATNPADVSVTFAGTYAGVLPTPTRTGYAFAGWYTGQNGSGTKIESTTTVSTASDHTLYAKWTIQSYVITFDPMNGQSTSSVTLEFGTSVVKPTDPTNTGYEFKYWYYLDSTSTEVEQTFPFTVPENGRTLYAKWAAINYTIIYDLDKGSMTGGNTNPSTYTIEDNVTFHEPTRAGYTFKGWIVNGDASNVITEINAGYYTEALSLKAKWEANTNTSYTVEYYQMGLDGKYPNNPTATDTSKTGTTDTEVNVSALISAPAGFTEDTTQTTYNVTITGDGTAVVKIYYSRNQYTLTWDDLNDSTTNQTNTVYFGATLTDYKPASDPTKFGYTFNGWDYSGNTTMPATDLTITATWKPVDYKIVFNPNGGVESAYEQEYTYGGTVTLSENAFTRPGYHFLGWVTDLGHTTVDYESGAKVDDALIKLANAENKINLYALWEVNSYTINYDGNLGAGTVESQTFADGEFVNAQTNAFERAGYTFNGWNTAKDGSGTAYAEGAVLNADALTKREDGETLTLYAQWKANTNIPYTVEHYLQELDGSYLTSASRTETKNNGTTDAVVDWAGLAGAFSGFAVDETKSGEANAALIYKADGTTLVKIYYTRQKYQLTWDDGSGNVNSSEVLFGATISKPSEVPAKTGHTFDGWYIGSEKQTFEGLTMPAYALTITAKYTINQYTISFDTGVEGITVGSITKDYGVAVDAPTAPTREGYTFDGWYTGEGGTGEKVDFTNLTMPVDGATYYAKWSINSYNLIYKVDGVVVDTIPVIYGTTITPKDNPTKAGYTFSGWSTIPATMPAGDVTITGTFTANTDTKYTVEHYLQNLAKDGYDLNASLTQNLTGTTDAMTTITSGLEIAGFEFEKVENTTINANGKSVVKVYYTRKSYTLTWEGYNGAVFNQVTLLYGETISAPKGAPTRTGYTFKDWGTYAATMPADNLTITAQWTANQYTIVFDSNGGTAVENITADYESEVNAPADPTRDGYTFGGWYTDLNDEETKVTFPVKMPLEGATYYAKWTANTDTEYTVEHYLMGVDGKYPATPNETEKKAGTTDTETVWESLVKDYPGLAVDGTKTVNVTISGDGKAVLKIYYIRNTYSVTWDYNDGTTADKVDSGIYYENTFGAPEEPTREGYTFGGWYTNLNDEATKWTEASTMPLDGVTYYAKWTPHTYTVVFDGNGADSGSTASLVYTYDVSQALTPNGYKLTGYAFTGWNTEKDGSGTKYTDGQMVENLTSVDGKTITLYAQWDESVVNYSVQHYLQNVAGSDYELFATTTQTGETNATTDAIANTYSGFTVGKIENVTILANGTAVAKIYYTRNSYTLTWEYANGEEAKAETVLHGSSIAKPSDPEKTGYTFDGWCIDETEVDFATYVMPIGNVTITAKYTINQYTINFNTGVEGITVGSITKDYGDIVTAPTAPTREGYTFDGWYTGEGGAGEKVDFTNLTMPVDGATYYAKWSINSYNLIYKVDGVVVDTIPVIYGTTITPKDNPTKAGYTFSGWSEIPATMPAEDVTITGTFTANTDTEYTVEHYLQNLTQNGYDRDDNLTQKLTGTTDTMTTITSGLEIAGFEFEKVENTTINANGESVVKVYYTRKSYTLTWEGYNGAVFNQVTLLYGETISAPKGTPTRTGYTFKDWGTYAATMPADNLTITAQWTANPYTVEFDSNGGTAVGNITAAYESEVNAPADPTRDGYTFGGWYTDLNDEKTKVTFPVKMPLDGATYYAKWTAKTDTEYTVEHYLMGVDGQYPATPNETEEKAGTTDTETVWESLVKDYPGFAVDGTKTVNVTISGDGKAVLKIYYIRNTYSVTWDYNDGTTADKVDSSIYYQNTFGAPAEPTREGYTFGGWYTNLNDETTKWTEASTMPLGGVTYYAKWTNNTYGVTFVPGNGASLEHSGTITVTFDTAYGELPTPTKPGYEFAGWYTAATNGTKIESDTIVSIADDHELYAVWTPGTTTYKVIHWQQNILDDEYTSVLTQTMNAVTEGTTNAVANPYTGFTAQEFVQKTVAGDGSTVINIYYTRNKFTLTWNSNGGQLSGDYTSGEVKYGATIVAPTVARNGYSFVNWGQTVAVTMPNSDLTYTANWNRLTYTITYEGMTGAIHSNKTSYTVEDADFDLIAPTKTGYTFLGWTWEGQTEPQREVTIDTDVASNLTYTANWSENTYKLVLHANDGTDTVREFTLKYTDVHVLEAIFTRSGYTFLGWSEKSEATVATHVTGDSLTKLVAEGTYDLHAVWSIITYDIGYDLGGGSVSGSNPGSYNVNDSFTLINPTKIGYTFLGWTWEGQTTPMENATISKGTTGDLNFVAHWQINTYTITFYPDNGETIDVIEREFGQTVNASDIPTPEKEGYTFKGWYLDAAFTQPVTYPITMNKDLDFYAKWEVNSYDLIYMVDGEEYERIAVNYGELLEALANPTKAGYTFSGWSEIPEKMPAKDVTIIGSFAPNTYEVTFDGMDGTPDYTSKDVVFDGTYGELPDAERTGYTFVGWFTAEGEQITADMLYQIVGDVTLYAHWTINQYDLTLNPNGGTVSVGTVTKDYGQSVIEEELAVPSRPGYRFDGWYWADGTKVTFPVTLNEDLTIVAKWTSYLNLLMAIDPESFANAESDADHKAALDLAREYYNLMKLDADLLTQYQTSTETYPEKDYSYNEHYEKLFEKIKQVALLELEASIESDETMADVNIELENNGEGEKIAVLDTDAVLNYVEVCLEDQDYLALNMLGKPFLTKLFKNRDIWSVDFPILRGETDGNNNLLTPYGQGVDTLQQMELMLRIAYATINEPEITGADDKLTYQEFFDWLYAQKNTLKIGVLDGKSVEAVLIAKTPEGVEYSTTYNINFYNRDHQITWNPANGENATEETYSYGDTITVPTPVREGYTFLGWEDAEGNAPVATMGKTDLAYTAQWKLNRYTITFANTGDTVIDPITKDFGAAVTAPADPTRVGYTFDGWDVEIPSTMPAGNLTVTAKWKANTYTITFENTGDSTIDSITQDFGTAIAKPADPVKEGYTFDGWDVEVPATMPAGDLTITAKWKINSYTITFDTDGGSEIAPITQEFDTAVTTPKNPTKEGYTFAGWDVEIPEKMPAGDMTVIAQWTINQYTITIDTVGGTTIAPITGDFGSTIGKIEDPEKEGYTFKGWDAEIPEKMPAKDMTITAVWEANEYTVTLNPGEGTLPGGSAITVTYGEYYVLPTPERDGYTFDGWYLGSEKITDTTLVEITADAELTAQWKVGNPYKVEYVLGDNAKWPTGANVVYQFTVEDSFTLPAPVREGYTFIGWTGSNGTTAQMSVTVAAGTTEDLTFTANWKVNSYTITFDTDGGSAVAPITGDFGTAIEKPADPTKEGYTFAGWDVTVPATIPAGDLTITATWTINEYTITFDSDGGTAVAPITKDFGEAVTAPASPTKEGYTFAGWDVEIPATMPAKNLTIKALWTVNQYTITFDTDGGSAVESITLNFGSAVTKPANPTKEGYTFAGWSVEIPATMPAKDMTIKAVWTINQYTITFDTNGGSTIDPIIRNYGAAVTAPVEPTREGYTFAGWDVEIPSTMPAKNLTITALWDINEYTITFVTGGGTEIRPMIQFFGSKVTAPADPTREGYTFDGWDVEIPSTMPAENLTITAKWKINSYNLIYKVDGEIIDSISLNYGTAISAKADQVKEGYTFSGWSAIPETMPAKDVEITGTFTANRYTVQFDPNYPAASQIAEMIVTFDGKYGTLPVVTRTGYTFAGWMLDGKEITADSVVKTAGDHTLTAKWTANTYQVTLNPNQGTLAGSNTITVTYDGTYAELPVPTRTGYDFIGWFDGETQISTDTVVSITAAQTLTARWNASGDTPYYVYHYQENLEGGYDLVLEEPFKGATDTIAQASQKNYTGFTYNSGKSTASGIILADGSLVLSLYYDRASYDIVWQVGSQEIRETYRYGETLVAPNTDRADDDRASYTFTGWNVTLPEMVTASATYVAQYSLDYEAMIGNTTYRTLKLALAKAKSGQQVVIARDVTMTEDLVVPAGVTLLIPCMDNDPGYVSRYNGKLMFNPDGTAVNGSVGVAANAELYRKLVIPEGVTLTIDGTVMVNAVTGRPAAGHYDMDVSDDYGQIDLDGDIVVRDGGQLDSFGFIKGSGTVTAKDGGTVGDLYVVRNWRGGSQAYQMYVENIYPMNEYDCHNIEADVRVEYGGSYEGLVKMYAGGEYNYTRFPQVDVDNGLIRSAEGGYVIRTYADGRETYNIYGGADLASSALNILGVDLTSADFMYPYDGDISLNLNDGKYYIVNNYKFLPGCEVTVGGDASLTVIKGVSAVFYQEFNDVGNRGTEYPDRDPARVIVKAGGTFTNAGTFAGHIDTESPNIWIGEGPIWEATTKEANGYFTEAQDKGEPTYVELAHALSITRPGHTWSFGADNSIVWDGKADYSKVQQAIASVPKDLSYYTADSIAAIQPALDQVVYDLDVSEQARVDAMAEPILAAVAGLVPKTITVTFDPNGGTVDTTMMDVTCTLEFGTLPTPTREYYRFTGWYDADGNRITKTSIVEEKTDFTLTARWEIKDADYGVVAKAIRKIPKDLSIYTDESVADLQAAQDAIVYNLTADRQAEVDAMAQAILDAIDGLKLWPITVTLDADGGTVDPGSVEATYGETFGTLPTPVREFHRFDGWYTADGALVTADTAVPANEDMTLTAHWTLLDADYSAVETAKNKIPADRSIYTDASVKVLQAAVDAVEYGLSAADQAKVDAMAEAILDAIDGLTLKTVTIIFAPNGGTVDPTDKVVTLTGTYGTLPTPVRDGYRFDGWYTADDKQVTAETVVSSDEGVTLTAKWTMIPADYSAVEEALAKIPADLSIYTAETTAAIQAAKDQVDYDLSTADQAKVDAMAAAILDAIDDLTLRKFVITFDAGYGTVTPSSKEVDYNTAYGELPVPTRTNYRFVGWLNADGEPVTDQTILNVTEDITLTAKWEALGADYRAVDDAIAKIPADLSIYTAETAAAVQAAKNAVVNGLPKEKQAEVDAMAKAILNAIDGLTVKTATITFDTNGGSAVGSITAEIGSAVTKPADPTREGYTFAGWSMEIPATMPAENITITAKWTMIPADYSGVENAIAKIPADLSIYTSESAAAVQAAKDAVEYGLGSAQQAKVDAMAKAILDAIDGLEAVLKSVEITKMPEKLLYIQGESLKLDDMVLTAHYSDGSSKTVTDYRVSGYNANVLGLQKVTITFDGKTTTLTVNVRSLVPTKITSDVYLVKDTVIRKIPAETTAEKLTAGINEKEYITIFKGSTVVSGNTLVGTGMVVKLLDGETVNDQVTVVVTGDVNGDGKITITDMIMVKSHLLKKSTLTGVAAYAADVNGDGKISITDFVQIKSHLLNKSTIQAN